MRIVTLLFSLTFVCNAWSGHVQVVTESFPPFSYLKDDSIEGVVTDRVKKVLLKAGLDFHIHQYPWARSFAAAKNNPNTLIYPIYRTKLRESYFVWFCPVYPKTPVYLFKLTSNPKDLSSLEAIKTGIIGVTRNDNSHLYLKSLGLKEGKNLDVIGDPLQNVINLYEERIDAVAQTKPSFAYRLKQHNLSTEFFEPVMELHPSDSNEHCMALNVNSEKNVKQAISDAFDLYRQDFSQANYPAR